MSGLRDYAAARRELPLALDPTASGYDEVVAEDGAPRDAWRRLLAGYEPDLVDLPRVNAEIERMLSDDGVVYAPPGQRQRRWRLDPVPLVIEAAEWADLEKGLAQRAELLNVIVSDLYTDRTILSRGLLPPEVVFAHRGFVRSLARPGQEDLAPVTLAAADLSRDETGEWLVTADRVQAPSGIGFAMENRRVLSRVLPRLHREAAVHRLTPFFQTLRSAILQAAPDGVESPHAVVLSPGPMSETVYDQASIAASMGFPLVEAADLTVSSGCLWLRSLDGLQRVDVVVRRVDAAWSDPLELRGDSRLGVPGLSEAVRRGNVRIVNSLGAGVAENPGLMPFLPSLCEELLGEPLRLSSARTYWGGAPGGRDVLIDRIDELRMTSLDGRGVPSSAEDLRHRIETEPWRWVGQESRRASSMPALEGDRLTPHTVRWRTFTMRHGASYRPMAGGLVTARSTVGEQQVSKDVWIVKQDPADPDQGLSELMSVTALRTPPTLPPRARGDMYWMGRYIVRIEDTLRLWLLCHTLALDFHHRPGSPGGAALAVLRTTLRGLVSIPDTASETDDLRAALSDADRPGSVSQSVEQLTLLAQSLRDQVSPDLFRVTGALARALGSSRERTSDTYRGEDAETMLTGALALNGVSENMVRDAAWRLHELGRSIERASQLTHLLEPTLGRRRGPEVDREVLDAVLQVSESAVTHRRRYRGYVRVANVVDLLVLDAGNPRSLRFCVERMQQHLTALPASSGSTRPERLVDDLLALLSDADLAYLVVIEGEYRPRLRELLLTVQSQLRSLSEAVENVHLASGPWQRPIELPLVIEP
ncbi:hypothetical protein BHE97_14990 [Aeromicrobium sp. PE09-221]|uniref:circularly permuted type 2 ATP-grasp protein n=1 Tax=Aeromicrobium sp. PE09-221 TaxID=1898043 RepID=UPI000B3E464A|nr:circularly permuted type 2 ATP-grasp protein [Aeromicrobium sp. PE09-221]OUZ08000.1 hypothetical protein BHE97_14990 [Aeromicrobium sp. PE09-221]